MNIGYCLLVFLGNINLGEDRRRKMHWFIFFGAILITVIVIAIVIVIVVVRLYIYLCI